MAARAAEKAKGNKNWNNILSQEELAHVTKNVEYGIEHTQFLYHLSGMPGIMGNPVGRMAFKLQSYPINYFMSYLGDMKNRLVTGSPGWDTTGKLKLPAMQRIGILKHFVVLGAVAAVAEEAGFNMSDIVGGYVSPIHDPGVKMTKENEAGQLVPRTGIDRIYNEVVAHKRIGTFNMRPSPSIAFLSAMKDLFSNEAYVRTKAQRQLEDLSIIPTGMIVPGGLAVRDILRAIEYEQPERIFLRKQMPKKTTAKKINSAGAFAPIQPIQPMQPFMGGR
jgi:hypothetical protein